MSFEVPAHQAAPKAASDNVCRVVLLLSYITVIIALSGTAAATSDAASKQFALPKQ